MKKQPISVFFVAIVVAFASCTGGQHNDADDTRNIITMLDNGTTFSDTIIQEGGGGVIVAKGVGAAAEAADELDNAMMQCSIHKAGDKSFFSLNYGTSTAKFPATIAITKAEGPKEVVGVYWSKVAGVTGALKSRNTFTETANGKQSYTVDSVMVNITKASGTSIVGDYKLWVSNASGSKTVTGSIDWNSARID